MRWFFLWLLVQFCTWGLDIVQICEFSKFFFPIFVPQNAKLYTNNESCQGALCPHFINDISQHILAVTTEQQILGKFILCVQQESVQCMQNKRKCSI